MSDVSELKKLCEKLEKQKEEQMRLAGRRDQLLQQLQETFECESIEEAEELKDELEKELEIEQEHVDESIEEISNILSKFDV